MSEHRDDCALIRKGYDCDCDGMGWEDRISALESERDTLLRRVDRLTAVVEKAIKLRDTEKSFDPEHAEENFYRDDCFEVLEKAEEELDAALAAWKASREGEDG